MYPKTNTLISKKLAEHGIGTVYECCGKPIAELGMESDATAAYFAVIVNQFGAAGARDYLRHIRDTLGLGEEAVFRDLAALHQAVHDTRDYGQACLSMRDKSYAYILSLGWPVREEPAPRLPALAALGENSGPLRLLLALLCRLLGLLTA